MKIQNVFRSLIVLFICFVAIEQASMAQWDDSTPGVIKTLDKVGIGLTNPAYKLDVSGSIHTNSWLRVKTNYGLYVQGSGLRFQAFNNYYWNLRSRSGLRIATKEGALMGIIYHNQNDEFGLLNAESSWVIRNKKNEFTAFDVNGGERMRLDAQGALMLGTQVNPNYTTAASDPYRLYVNGGILAKEVKIETGWADYVFEEDYELTSLTEVEAIIEEKGHLHNTPSAKELEAAGGVELGTITVNQQEKIEELFLHLIELNKKVERLEEENAQLKSQK